MLVNIISWIIIILFGKTVWKHHKEESENWEKLRAKQQKNLTQEGYFFWMASNDPNVNMRKSWYKMAKNAQIERRYKRRK